MTVSYLGFHNGDTPASLTGTLAFATGGGRDQCGRHLSGVGVGSELGELHDHVCGRHVDGDAGDVDGDGGSVLEGVRFGEPDFTVSYLGFDNGDTPASLTGTLAFATVADATSAVGTYPMSASGLSSANYTITFVDGTLTVTPAALTVTVDPTSKVFGSANPTSRCPTSGSTTVTRRRV